MTNLLTVATLKGPTACTAIGDANDQKLYNIIGFSATTG